MADKKDGFAVDIGEVMVSLAELGIPRDIQEDCLRLLMHKKDKRSDRDARETDRKSGGSGRAEAPASAPASHPPPFASFDANAAQQAATTQKSMAPLIEGATSEDEDHVITMPCMRSSVGRVIGKSGDTIKALQQYTKTSIQIDQSTDPTLVTISGSVKSVRIAVAMISDIIDGRFKGFAMLRQITRGDVPNSGGSQHATVLSPDGMIINSSHSSASSRDVSDVWTPNYVQGYGFLPPTTAPLGQASGAHIESGHLDYSLGAGSALSAGYDDGQRRNSDGDRINRQRGTAGATWPSGPTIYRTSSVPLSSTDLHAALSPDVAHRAMLSRLTHATQDQHRAHRTHELEQETILSQQKASGTTENVLRTLMQLRQRQLEAQVGEEKEDDSGSYGSGNFQPRRFQPDGTGGR